MLLSHIKSSSSSTEWWCMTYFSTNSIVERNIDRCNHFNNACFVFLHLSSHSLSLTTFFLFLLLMWIFDFFDCWQDIIQYPSIKTLYFPFYRYDWPYLHFLIFLSIGGQTVGRVVEGQPAFIIWKSLYFSKLLSSRNQAQVIFDWISTTLFGRDISTVHNIQATTVPKKVQIPDTIKTEILHNIQATTVQTTDIAKMEIEWFSH